MVAMLITVLAVVVLVGGYYFVLWCLADRRRDRAVKVIDAQVNRLHRRRELNPQARTPHTRRDLAHDNQTPAGPLPPPHPLRTGGDVPLSRRLAPARADSTASGNVPAGLAGGAGTLPPPSTSLRLRPAHAGAADTALRRAS